MAAKKKMKGMTDMHGIMGKMMKGEMKPHGKKHEGKESKPFEKKERGMKGYPFGKEKY